MKNNDEFYNKIGGRLNILANKAGYSADDINWYTDQLKNNSDLSVYHKMSGKDLLDDFKLTLAKR